MEESRPLQSTRERDLWLSGRWSDIQIGHKAWINRDDDGRVVIPREIVRDIGMKDKTRARTLYIRDLEDLAAAAGPRSQELIRKGAKAVLLLFSDKQEDERLR